MSKPAVALASLLAALALTVVGLGVLVVPSTGSSDARFALLDAIERTQSARYVHIETQDAMGEELVATDYEFPDRFRNTTYAVSMGPDQNVQVREPFTGTALVAIGQEIWSGTYRTSDSSEAYHFGYEHCRSSRSDAAQLLVNQFLSYFVERGRDFDASRHGETTAISFLGSVPTPRGEDTETIVVRVRGGRVVNVSQREAGQRPHGTVARYTYEEPTDPIEPPPAELVTSSRGSCDGE